MKWHTAQERRVIKKHGGQPLVKSGYDGKLRGRPVEVRSVKKDHRYRIQKDVHRELVRKNGYYIFCAPGRSSKVIPASRVSSLLGSGPWYKDRNYPHKFVTVGRVHGKT